MCNDMSVCVTERQKDRDREKGETAAAVEMVESVHENTS